MNDIVQFNRVNIYYVRVCLFVCCLLTTKLDKLLFGLFSCYFLKHFQGLSHDKDIMQVNIIPV